MEKIKNALMGLNISMSENEKSEFLSFEEFIQFIVENPVGGIRNVFQIFYDMVKLYTGEGFDEYPEDPESIKYIDYDCKKLFVEGSEHPFFADRLFANRFINHVEAMKHGAQQNKIYIFEGPHGSGKSTFLNNLLKKFQEYANIEEGSRYETIWRIEKHLFRDAENIQSISSLDKLAYLLENPADIHKGMFKKDYGKEEEEQYKSRTSYIEIPCVCHDHPILLIPKKFRRAFFDELFQNEEFKWKLFTDKEYEWVFNEDPCTICTSLYNVLLKKLKSPSKVFELIYARKYHFNRRLGEGINVFNPGDKPSISIVNTNSYLQTRIDRIFEDSNLVKYIYSKYAKSNNGIYALMDIKSHNTERLVELHNIISEGVHKVEDIEENVNSLFFALMNPEDKENIKKIPSFTDRIEYIKILYVLDIKTEVEIYRNIFGKHIDEFFLPRVLHNFARVIISSRLNAKSDTLKEWIGDPGKYKNYCDENLLLLKMEIYTGYIPNWLTEDDRKKLTAKVRHRVIAESESEGMKGISGRDSIRIFNELLSIYSKPDKIINMSNLCSFFAKFNKEQTSMIPEKFLDSLVHNYDYSILQEVKESLYNYNEKQISNDIKNYIFAVNFEDETTETCIYTGEKINITPEFLESIENRIIGAKIGENERKQFRNDIQNQYTTITLTQEILVEGKDIAETKLYAFLYERYVYNLKERVLDPLLDNENFRSAIKDYDQEGFKSYDSRIKEDVEFLIKNLCDKYKYSKLGAKEICIYAIDNEVAKKQY